MFSNKKLLSKEEQIKKMTAISATLEAEEADQFLTYLIDQSVLKNNARIVKMNTNSKKIRALGFGTGRFLVNADEYTSSGNTKTAFGDHAITLTAKKVRGSVAIYDDDLEDVVNEAQFKDAIMQLVAAKIGNELEDIAYGADANDLGGFEDADPRSMWDGWRYQITHSDDGEDYENDVTGSAVVLDATLTSPNTTDFDKEGGISELVDTDCCQYEHKYAKMLKNIPAEYLGVSLADWRFWNHDRVSMNYNEALSKRNTPLGDAGIVGTAAKMYGSTPIISCARMPLTLDSDGVIGGGSYTDVLLTPAKNLIVGLQRMLKIEADRDAANERTIWYFSLRGDFAIEDIHACVLTKNLTW